jgi:iron complex outermembrane recepter protein
MSETTMRSRYLYSAAILAIAAPSAAWAQSSAEIQSDSKAADANEALGNRGVADIIVTATRRAENIQTVPVSVSVVQEVLLKSLNVSQTTDLVKISPGLNFSYGSYGNSASFVLRGVSTFANSNAIESSTGVAIDGVPMARTVGQVSDIVDIERIEVLRGPQGTVFGKNSTAGIVSIVTARPDFTLNGNFRLYYGSGNEIRAQAVANVPLVADTLAMRVAAWSFTHDPYIATPNGLGGLGSYNNKGARLSLRFAPSPDLDINLISQYSRQDDSSVGYYTIRGYVGITTNDALPAPLLAQSLAGQNADLSQGVIAGPNNYASSANLPSTNVVRTFYNTLQVDYNVGEHKLALIASYQDSHGTDINDGDQGANVAPAPNSLASTYYIDVRHFNAEMRLISPANRPVTYVGGLFYYNAKIDTRQDQIFERIFPSAVGRSNISDVHSVNYAAFGEAVFHLSDDLRFLAGGRLAHDDIDGHYVRTIPAPAVAVPNSAYGPINVNPASSYTNFSWRVGAQLDLGNNAMSYLTVSRGYKGPGFNFANDLTVPQYAVNQAKVRPEHVTSYELGIKSRLLDNTLRANAALYYARYTDFQVSAGLPTTPLSFALINAPLLIAKGGEAEIDWRPGGGFSLNANVAYSAGHFGDFKNAPCYFGQTAAQGCVGSAFDVTGAPLTNSPRWTTNLTARYDVTSDKLNAFFQANYYRKGSVYYSVGREPATHAPAFGLVNLTAGIRTPDDRLGLTVFGKNIFDKHYVSRLIVAGGNIGQNLPFDSQARYGVALDARF